jgi:hypothetical protein
MIRNLEFHNNYKGAGGHLQIVGLEKHTALRNGAISARVLKQSLKL